MIAVNISLKHFTLCKRPSPHFDHRPISCAFHFFSSSLDTTTTTGLEKGIVKGRRSPGDIRGMLQATARTSCYLIKKNKAPPTNNTIMRLHNENPTALLEGFAVADVITMEGIKKWRNPMLIQSLVHLVRWCK